jgi:exodeoxyribonuclease-3
MKKRIKTSEETLTLLSWNVNGVRAAAKKGFLDWLGEASPDLLGLQETKAMPEQLGLDLLKPPGYRTHYHPAERKGYSGTAVFAKVPLLSIREGTGVDEFDHEGRVIVAEMETFFFVTVYVPNGKSDLSRVEYKIRFSDALMALCDDLRGTKGVVLCGDINTAHREIDLARPQPNRKNTGFLPRECAWLDKFTAAGYVDTFRHFHPDETGAYSWWDYRTRARPKNVGWRLDYVFVSSDLLPRVRSAFILSDVMGSDHCPVGIELGT